MRQPIIPNSQSMSRPSGLLPKRPPGYIKPAQTRKLSRPEPIPETLNLERVDRYSRLERIRKQRSLMDCLDERSEAPGLEYLSVLHSPRSKVYWIGEYKTGSVLVKQPFKTSEHCHKAAAELEHTFEMAEVLTLRPPETLERMEAIALAAVWRETVELAIALTRPSQTSA